VRGITALKNSGGSEVLGQWANYVDQDKISLEDLCDVALLFLEAAIQWRAARLPRAETEHGTNSDTKAEVDR
jgi:hypothetical protein